MNDRKDHNLSAILFESTLRNLPKDMEKFSEEDPEGFVKFYGDKGADPWRVTYMFRSAILIDQRQQEELNELKKKMEKLECQLVKQDQNGILHVVKNTHDACAYFVKSKVARIVATMKMLAPSSGTMSHPLTVAVIASALTVVLTVGIPILLKG